MKTTADFLTKRSQYICSLNHCTEEEHFCESYAYLRENLDVIDICISDYFQGSGLPYAAILLPWNGTQAELEEEVRDQIADIEGEV